MLGQIEQFREDFAMRGAELTCPNVVQTLSIEDLIDIVPHHDGWIIGDDPATAAVFEAGKNGRLKAAVKWGIGVDNVDLGAARKFGIPVSNTPFMFGREVADIAMSYVVALARGTFSVDRGVRSGAWPKPIGISLAGKTAGVVGFGDIGRNIARRMLASDMKVIAFDPAFKPTAGLEPVELGMWPQHVDSLDFLVLACNLTLENRHMVNADTLRVARPGLRVVNVARGPLIDEAALIEALMGGLVHSAALDVMEIEPLPLDSMLRTFDTCIFGSHNSSNTVDAVQRASKQAIELLFELMPRA